MAAEYVALFCPNCGVHLNEVEEQDCDPDVGPRFSDFGSRFTCGWCHVETNDWSHVARCRREAHGREVVREKNEAAQRATTVSSLIRLIMELEEA